mgnify:CR=1 FL=1
MEYIVIDGSMGEGGGQVLRISVALASVLMKPIKVVNIRAKRRNPGLQSQHLTAVKAAAELTDAAVEGLYLRSTEITYIPRRFKPGKYVFDVGTAGSVTLVLQTIIPILAFMPSPCEVEIRGGTDVPWSPPIDYLRNVISYYLKLVGIELDVKLIRRGHYPVGGGIVVAKVANAPVKLRGLELIERGEVLGIKGISHCVRLPKHVAERQASAAEKYLREAGIKVPIDIGLEYYELSSDSHLSPGSGIVLWAETSNGAVIGSDALGAKWKRAEEVGLEAAKKLIYELESKAAFDSHMSDNIIPYLALAEGDSAIGGSSLTMHTYTVIEVVKKLVKVDIKIYGELEKPFKAFILGTGCYS